MRGQCGQRTSGPAVETQKAWHDQQPPQSSVAAAADEAGEPRTKTAFPSAGQAQPQYRSNSYLVVVSLSKTAQLNTPTTITIIIRRKDEGLEL